jgi:predicted acylesterase/phospholipase RssA
VHSTIAVERERDRHLFSPGPKRLLALDGGGVRGAITVAFLEQIEAVLCKRLGKKEVHLGDWFDLIGGTSTGAIIAGALALGYSIQDVKRFYDELAPKVFKGQSWWRLLRLQPKFDAEALRAEIREIVGDITLDTEKLITGLCVVSKRIDTGSPWILANNSRAPYWEANKNCKLGALVRASTAAPFYFEPEPIVVNDQTEEQGTFIDGGVTPHNNPSLVLFLMTILKPFNICWDLGPDKLTVVSIGTGTHRSQVIPDKIGFGRTARLAIHALTSMMHDAQTFVLQQMQYLGECPAPWLINSEIGTLAGDSPPHGKLFRFIRYDVRLELPWIEEQLVPYVGEVFEGKTWEKVFGKPLTLREVIRMRSMDDPSIIPDIYKLAKIAAARQVKPEHWVGALPGWCDGTHPSAKTRPRLKEKTSPADRYFGGWIGRWR